MKSCYSWVICYFQQVIYFHRSKHTTCRMKQHFLFFLLVWHSPCSLTVLPWVVMLNLVPYRDWRILVLHIWLAMSLLAIFYSCCKYQVKKKSGNGRWGQIILSERPELNLNFEQQEENSWYCIEYFQPSGLATVKEGNP